MRRLRPLSALITLLSLWQTPLFACPICFRVEENATTDGVLVAVFVLLGVTTVVLGAFGTFVVRLARREWHATRHDQIPDPRCPEIPDPRFQIP